MGPADAVEQYALELKVQLATGHAAEHAYRPALKQLMERLGEIDAVNDPKRSEHGAPDFVFVQQEGAKIIRGWAEAKDLDADLDKVEKTEQLQRYAGYPSLFLTNYIEFRFFENGSKYETIEIGSFEDGGLVPSPARFGDLAAALEGFLTLPPEAITSGERLAEVMGAKARRIRHNVERFLSVESEKNDELLRIFELIKTLLVHELDEAQFADMYAQTLVYGLFAARYNDDTPVTFSRAEARDLVPSSNPFLREFFDHIAGSRFDARLAYIVDELCEVFAISSVHEIIHEHLAITSSDTDDKDPIIHFYEDFLKAYDPEQRKKMGAYYTPLPVVRFMVRTVDELLKRDFDLPKGLADTSTVTRVVTKQDKKVKVSFHRVQILDPAVGTATFLNEIVKFVSADFEGQEGRWPTYAKEDLIPRLHGFELMMAPYTVAHLKLGLTLQESGVEDFGRRLGIYLTNSLEQGVDVPEDLLQLGLAEAVAQEAIQAGEIKTERPIMVMIGNPPYRGESSNKTKFAMSLVSGYKFEPGGRLKLQERNSKWLNDDYVKFIAFAEAMVKKNGAGVVAMITNHAYLDNPTFRGMRWRLTQTFDELYVLDLHGNSKRKEVAPDGGRDENVFDIQQGVAIMFGVMRGDKQDGPADVFHADAWGARSEKFGLLNRGVDWSRLELDKTIFLLTPRDTSNWDEYAAGVPVNRLFAASSVGIVTSADEVFIGDDVNDLERRLRKAQGGVGPSKALERLRDHTVDLSKAQPISYRPFDDRMVYYDTSVLERSREKVMKHFIGHPNIGLIVSRQAITDNWSHVQVTSGLADNRVHYSNKGISVEIPLYIYHDDGSSSPNFDGRELAKFTAGVDVDFTPEDILDYVYGVLHSPAYRARYKEFLKADFPCVPAPGNDDELGKFVGFGRQLRRLHLTMAEGEELITTYPVVGSDKVEKPRYRDGRAWINSEQYFGGVPEVAWELLVGGYRPAQKWLKDRKDKVLSSDEIEHYQRIIAVLSKTDELMRQIDA